MRSLHHFTAACRSTRSIGYLASACVMFTISATGEGDVRAEELDTHLMRE